MLVLTRKPQQQIRIGDNITVTIVKIKGNTVRVGIEAPRSVRVVRGELPVKAAQPGTTSSRDAAPLCELTSSGSSTGKSSTAGDDAAEPCRLHGLVAKFRQAAAVAHAI
jgi:carbon storage regulator CsrA